MTPIRVLIVEDEILIALTIKMYLNERGHSVTEIVISFEEAVAAYEKEVPDVILIDIRLYGEKSGIDFAEYLRDNHRKTPFVYLTSQFDKRIVQAAMASKPHGYLTKPIQKETLWTTIELAYHLKEKGKDATIHIHDGAQSHIIAANNIKFIRADHVYIIFEMVDGKSLVIRQSLADIVKHLNKSLFVQCHRSYIININHVQSYNNQNVIIDQKEIPLSRTRKSEVIAKIKEANS
jgi:DNA-binding LytR/AlgR family response regulator